MLSLNDREWKGLKVASIVDEPMNIVKSIDFGKTSIGENVFIGRQTTNNGIQGFVDEDTVEKENCITIGMVGVPTAYWQEKSFVASQNILVLRNKKFNKYNALFICGILNGYTLKKFNYGKPVSKTHFPNQIIMLPINADGNPDYDFMEAYVKQQGQVKVDTYIQYCKECLSKLGVPAEICNPDKKEWQEFFVDDIFTIDSGKRLESYNMTAGNRPFIGATDSGNGVTNYISNENESLDNNVLGVNYNGNGMVISFYHPYECLFSDDVKRFHLKNHPDNKYVLLFFKTLILQQKAKYNYGYKFNATRMKRQKIMLPVTETGEPDYDYMEQYAKNMMIRKYQGYLDYIN